METLNFKSIHIGKIIKERIGNSDVNLQKVCSHFGYSVNEIKEIYKMESIDTKELLRWSKLLRYDFFRFYSQHLILYSPPEKIVADHVKKGQDLLKFRKNIYTMEVIEFILDLIKTETKTKMQIMEEYKIPKTTLYKWISKYSK